MVVPKMSKATSGLFPSNEKRELSKALKSLYNTSIIWDHLTPTQDNYTTLELPKSFEIDISKGKMWVHGNATKHMFQEIAQNWKGKNPMKISNQTLYTQFVLYDFYQNLNSATAKGIKYGTIQTVGNWEFIFSHPRIEGGLPVVKHAQFLGWNHKEDKYD